MGRVLPVLRAFSLILAMFAATMLVPLAVSWVLGDGAAFAYDEAFLVTGATAGVLWLLSRRCTREPQIKDGFLLVVTYGSVLVVAWYLWQQGTYTDFPDALRFSAFNVVSIATTTGYASTDYSLWPHFAPLWMLFLCTFAMLLGRLEIFTLLVVLTPSFWTK